MLMPVKYSVVKDLDCFSNRLSGQAQRTADYVPRMRETVVGQVGPAPPESNRGQLDAEIGRPAPDRLEKLIFP